MVMVKLLQHIPVFLNLLFITFPLRILFRHFLDHPLHEILISQVYCVSVYILHTYLCFTHNIKISFSLENQFSLPLRMHGLCIDKMVAGWKGLYLELCSHCQNLEKSIKSWILVSYFKSSKNLTSYWSQQESRRGDVSEI